MNDMNQRLRRARVGFLFAEAQTGLTMLETARITEDALHAKRAIGFAREAHESLQKFRDNDELTPGEREELDAQTLRLADGLAHFGQSPIGTA